MDMAWFIYTISLMLLMIIACSTCFMVWVLTSRRDWLVAAAAFVCYVLEVSVIFYGEYMGDKPYLTGYFNDGLQWPWLTIPLDVILVTLVWSWARERVHAPLGRRQVAIFAVVFGVVAVAVAPIGSLTGAWRNMLFWGWRDLGVIFSVWFGYWWYQKRASKNERVDIERSKPFFRVVAVLSLVMLCEDIFFIMIFHPETTAGTPLHSFFWHLTERNMTENAIVIICAVRTIMGARDLMMVYAQHPAESSGDHEADRYSSDIGARLPRFCDQYAISQREREVLRLVLLKKSTQEIASDLFISTGTVKAHLHRIYSKVGTTNRQDLATAFWKF
ncbi:MAG: LuxR C-terminal-related transcriptional regulator [Olsenella sp.]|jgi:DNA-binding CsgD family transcriptional regulator